MRFYFILSFLLSSCSMHLSQNSQVEKFESCIGKEIAKNLDWSVVLLDSLVSKYYNTSKALDSMYSDFIKEVINEQVDWEHFYEGKTILDNYYSQVISCGLADELYLKYKGYILKRDFADEEALNINDTAEINIIVLEYEYISKDSIKGLSRNVMWFLSDSEKKNIDSVVLHAKNDIKFNMYNKYSKGLELISKNNKLVEMYMYERKQYYGMVSPSSILKGWEKMEVDTKDYFFRRILAIELFLWSDMNKKAIQQAISASKRM